MLRELQNKAENDPAGNSMSIRLLYKVTKFCKGEESLGNVLELG